MADDDQVLPSHFSSFDTSLPASFSNMGEDTMQRPEDRQIGQGLSGIPSLPATWADVGHYVAAGGHELAATGAGFAAAMSGDPATEAGWRRTVKQQQLSAEESRAAATPTAQPGWSHPVLWAAEQAPGLAALAIPAAAATAVAGPLGGAAVLGTTMGAQTEGDIYNREVGEGIEPTFRQKAGAFALGAAQGLAMDLTGGLSKVAVSPIVGKALTGIGDSVVFGAGSAAQEYTAQKNEISAGKRTDIDQNAVLGAGVSGAETGIGFGVTHLLRGHGDPNSGKTRLPKGGESAEPTGSETDYQKAEAKTPSPPTAVEATNTGPAPPSSPVGAAEELALKGQQAPAPTPPPTPQPEPTPRVGEQQVPPVVQPSGAQPVGEQPSVETAQEAVGAPPAGIEPSPVSPPPPTPPTPPTPEPTRPVAESEATLREQQAALLDPQNPREAVIYPLGVKPIGITQNKGRFGTTRLADGRWVQYDTRGPRRLSKTLIAEYEKNNDLNGLLQLGDVPQTEAVKQSVAGVEPAVVTERAPPSTPGEPGIERKAAAGTTATAPSQVEALEATKTPGSTVQVETPEETIGDRFKRVQAENLARQAAEAATPEATPRVEPTKMAETKHLSVWDRGDGTYFKRYAADGREENITKTVADLLAKNEPYVPAEKVDLAATRTEAPPPVSERRILRSETEEEKQAAARQAEADAAAAARVAAEQPAKPITRQAKPIEEQKPGKKSPEEKEAMRASNAVADEVVRNNLPQAGDEHAPDPARGSGGKGARDQVKARAAKMVKEAVERGFQFMKLIRDRKDPELAHSASSILLHEAKRLADLKVAKTVDFKRFLDRERDLLKGEAAKADVLKERRAEGKEFASAAGRGVREVATEGVETGEAKGIEPVEMPDVAEEMAAAKERVAEEEVAKKPGEERKLTENERRAQEASERARAKLEAREKAAPLGVEGRVRPAEGEGRAEAPAPKAAVGFTVEKRRTIPGIKKQELPEIEIRAETGKAEKVTPVSSVTGKEAVEAHFKLDRYSAALRPMMERLRDAVLKLAGDTEVHYISHDDMMRLFGAARGVYDGKHIYLNADRLNHDTALHEVFHAATSKAILNNLPLWRLMQRLRDEVENRLPSLTEEERKTIQPALDDPEEFLTYMMTSDKVQDLLKGIKISDELARDIGIPKWRKATMWNGILHIIQKALGLEPRDVSAIEAAMAITEHTMWSRDPGMVMQAAGRLAQHQMQETRTHFQRIAPSERDQEAFMRSPREQLSRVKDIDTNVVKSIGRDIGTNTSAKFLNGHLNWLAGNFVDEFHGDLFVDAKGRIIQAINRARDKVSYTYNHLREGDLALRQQAYGTDRIYASRMNDYNNLVGMSVRYNIHADRPPSTSSKSLKHVQRDANWQRAHDLYKTLPEALQKRYRDEKAYGQSTQVEAAKSILENTLPLFDPPKGSTLEEVLARAKDNNLTEADRKHYEEEGALSYIDKATRLMGRKDVYFNSQRSGDFVVSGRYDMPAGGHEKDYSGESLPDHQREFDTEDEARKYAADTPLPATIRAIHYWTDKATGKTERVPSDFASSDPGRETIRHQVSLERQHTEFAKSKAEGERSRAAMDAAGVKELSGVMDRRADASWGRINSSQQKVLERRINSRRNLTDTQKNDLVELTRQMMLASQNSYSPHMMQRRKVFGADYSTAEGLDRYSQQIHQMAARSAHRAELDAAMSRLDEHEKATRGDVNAYRRSVVANNMRDRVHSDTLSSKVSPILRTIMTYAFTNFLLRPSHILIQQLHPYIYSIPHIAARHGMWKSLQGQRQAMKDLGGRGHNLWEGIKSAADVARSLKESDIDKMIKLAHGADPISRMIDGLKNADERAAMRELQRTDTLHSAFDASVFAGGGMDRWNAMLRQFTDAMEANNRLSTALNAYRLDKAMHGNKAMATEYARSTIEHTHGIYSTSNVAPVFKNPLMRAAMQFRQQPANLFIMLVSDAMRATKGDAEAKRAFFYQLATAGAVGGVSAMPTFPLKLAGLAGAAVGGPLPSDYDDKIRRGLVDTIGETATNILYEGLPSLAGPYGFALGERAGLNPDFLFGDPSSGKPKDMIGYLAMNAIGASGSLGVNTLQGIQNLENGDYGKAAEMLLPGSMRDIFKAVRAANEGVVAGGKQVQEGSLEAALTHLAGFSSLPEMRAQEGHYALERAIRAQNKEEKEKQSVGAQLKVKHKQGREVLGVTVTKKNQALTGEYGRAYQ